MENEQIPVKATIVADTVSRQFLERLGFVDFDLIEFVSDFVLPHYPQESM
jgi:hypothetical protein